MRTALLTPLCAGLLGLLGCDGGDASDAGPDADTDVDTDSDADNGVAGDEPCPPCDTPPSCSRDEVLSCCVCVPRPGDATPILRTRCDQLVVPEFCGTGQPDLSCFEAPPEPIDCDGQPDLCRLLPMRGTLDVFGNGIEPDGVLVEVFEEVDGTAGDPLGSAVSDVAGCGDALDEDVAACVAAIESNEPEDCECVERDPGSSVMNPEARLLAYFAIDADIPLNTPLVVVTSGSEAFWKHLYSFNVVNEEEDVVETVEGSVAWYKARVLSVDDYESIPAVAYGGRIDADRGAIAGEIHDCSDVRLSYVQVNTNPEPPGDLRVFYFNGDDEHPLPVSSRIDGTDPLGLYSSMNIPAGPTYVAAVGSVGGRMVSLGWYRAEVVAGAVTAVTLRGIRPHQIGE